MKVLSLFDGISIAQQALKELNVPVETYYASEIDKYAISLTQKNHPNTIQLGSVTEVTKEMVGEIDLIIGGSPCQDLSIAKKGREGLQGSRSGLFYEFVRLINEVKPKYFVLENVNSMPKEAKETISEVLFGIQPVMINAALVSAQNRKRLFWVGKRVDIDYDKVEIEQPQDKGIVLKDILEENVDEKYCVSEKHRVAMINTRKSGKLNIPDINGKCGTITSSYYKIPNDGNYVQVAIIQPEDKGILLRDILESDVDEKYYLSDKLIANFTTREKRHSFPFKPMEKTQEKSPTLTARYFKMAATDPYVKDPVRIGQLNSGGQGDRIYSQEGKSVALSDNGGGRGAKTGLYAIQDKKVMVRKYEVDTDKLKIVLKEHKNLTNKEIADKLNQPITLVEHWFRNDNSFSIPAKDIWLELKELLNIKTDEFDKSIMEFEIKNGSFDQSKRVYIGDKTPTLQTSQQSEFLVNQQIRKLTPIECERLQSLPDNYTEGVSNTQRYKALGNGFNCEVIKHILKHII